MVMLDAAVASEEEDDDTSDGTVSNYQQAY